MNSEFIAITDEESIVIEGGSVGQAVGYAAGAYSVGTLSAAVFGTVTGTASLVATGALVASGVGLGIAAVGLAGCAVYSLFN